METFVWSRVNPYSEYDLRLKRILVRYKGATGQLRAAIGALKSAH